QSSTLLLMAACGELEDRTGFPPPELAVFADTGWEAPGTYEWLALLRIEAGGAGIRGAEVGRGHPPADRGAAGARRPGRGQQPARVRLQAGQAPRRRETQV